MEVAERGSIHFAVVHQGAMLGCHDEKLSATRLAVDSLSAQVTELTNQLHRFCHGGPSNAEQPMSEPRVNNPPRYTSQPSECRSFLTQCEVVFSLQPSTYATNRSRVAFILSLLTGQAREWGAAVWEAESDCCSHYASFKEEMLKVFGRSVLGREASRQLAALRQGGRSAADFAIQFRTLAATSEWNEPALVARFLDGLSSELKEELYFHRTTLFSGLPYREGDSSG